MIEWNKNYILGIEIIDKQHKCLVNLINQLHEVQQNTNCRNTIESVFLGLTSYCEYHFEKEEMVMQECNYTDYEKHKIEHDNFFNNIEKAKLGFINGDIHSLIFISDYLKVWILDHILVQDKKYVKELREKF